MSWSAASPDKPWHVYVIGEEGLTRPVKVGTANNVAYRLASLQCGNWRRLIVYAVADCAGRFNALAVEKYLLQQFAEQRLPGRDWLNCTPQETAAALQAHHLVTGVKYGAN